MRKILLLPLLCFIACSPDPKTTAQEKAQKETTQRLMALRQKYGCNTILRNSTIDKTLTIGFTQCDSLKNINADDSTLYVVAQQLSIDVYQTLIAPQDERQYERIAINLLSPRTTIAAAATTRQAVFDVKDVAKWADNQ